MTSSVPWRLRLAGFLTLAAMAVYWWWPGGSDPRMAGQEVETPGARLGTSRSLGEGATTSPSPIGPLAPRLPDTGPVNAAGESAAAREERLLIARLHRQGVRLEPGDQLKRQEWALYPEQISYLLDSSNWMPELMKARSSIQARGDGAPSRLSLERIEADSILWDLGLREGDVIVLIDGQIPQFSPTKALDYIRKADAVLAGLDRGEAFSLTVLRRNRPVHLVFRSP